MKHKGARYQYAAELESELMQKYREEKRRQVNLYGRVNERLLVKNLSEVSVSRFYCSEEYAYTFCKDIIRGKPHQRMQHERRNMYYEILSRVIKLQKQKPGTPFRDLVTEVCDQPAPRFYLTPGSIRYKISIIKNRCRNRHKEE